MWTFAIWCEAVLDWLFSEPRPRTRYYPPKQYTPWPVVIPRAICDEPEQVIKWHKAETL